MTPKSRLAQLRSDVTVIFGCIAVSAVVAGSLAVQAISAQNEAQAKQHQDQQAKVEQAQRDAATKAQIIANSKAWEQWRDYIEPQCENTVSRLERNRSYRNFKIYGNPNRPVYDGLVICDRNFVSILKGAMLRPAYVVPRSGSPYPMPSDNPPPEFAPYRNH
ncbi:hypothetical protein [Leptolyngbya sp. NIES-2104]|uniref:hypothetical protein n=1 Tax=Leptolyngbya sp. NIES-2104 TaxID=1552121 RepID=UPI0006EC6E1A|nr:hypothetical protein [Leptolyngbya sp. NIES-2104]GAQ00161.1 hypothetical protein NIES2104_67260 [Leptolyngbya sp. NIES-2104]